MKARSVNRFKALALILLAIFIAQQFASSTLFLYIAPRNGWLALASMILLILMAGAFRTIDHTLYTSPGQETEPDSRNLISVTVLMIPVILGMVVPPRIFGENDALLRGMATEMVQMAHRSDRGWPDSTIQRDVLDWVHIMSEASRADSLNGLEAEVVGFVYRDDRLASDQFIVGRFTLVCCASDAHALGVPVISEYAHQLKEDTWVRVGGFFEQGALGGEPMPVLRANQIEHVEPLEQPYLYP